MAFVLVHTFTSTAGITYFIEYDFDLLVQQTTFDPPDATPETSVTEPELEFAEGDLITSACFHRDKISLYASLNFPFLQTPVITRNSPDCNFTPPTCDFIPSAVSSSATNGNNNGSITVANDVSGSTIDYIFQFSLDASSWQSSPIFNFLFPGNYVVYIRTSNGCLKTLNITVANEVVELPNPLAAIPFEQSNRMCFFFRLNIDNESVPIEEPIKWDDVNIIGERDQDFHGYMFKHTDGLVDLGFDCPAGKEAIEAVYQEKGQDGDIGFQYGYTFDGEEYILFDGKLMLNTRKLYADRIECTVETKDLDTAFQSRIDTPVTMTQDKSFDNENVPVPSPYTLQLHPKIILTKFSSDNPDKNYMTNSYTPETRHIYVKPDNTSPSLADLQENFQYPLGMQIESPYEVLEYYFKFFVGGEADIFIDLSHYIGLKRDNTGDDPDWIADLYLVRKKYSTATQSMVTTYTKLCPTKSGEFNNNGYIDNLFIAGSYTGTETFTAGDELYVFYDIYFDRTNRVRATEIIQYVGIFDVQYRETSAATPANGWFLEDVIRQCINVIGNNKYAFRSSFLERINSNQSVDGCGSKYMLFNGYQIRQFETATRPLKVALKTVLNSVRGMFCIGMNFYSDDNGSFVRIERADFYYQDKEIIAIDTVEDSSYKDEVITEQIYNEVEVGYEKYQDSGYNSLDEFNTKMQALTPIKKNKKKLSVLSSFIASGYRIEDHRRQQFNETPSSSVENDEDPFIVSVKRDGPADWSTEKDEAFQTVTGIISPETSYNLRISPKRLLYNWFIWLKGIFAYKQDEDVIHPTQILQNNDLVTRFNTDETCRVGDVDRATIIENADEAMTALTSTRNIWRPEKVSFKCRLNPTQVQTINLAMAGKYGISKDYGYIMVKKPNGGWQAIWLDKISYNYWTEKAEITGKKLYESPEAPNDGDCCNWLVVNGCRILVNGEKLIA